MSIDKYQQSMENWKKEIIVDPHLNALFDHSLSPPQFLQNKLLHLPRHDIIQVYMKLTSLKHSITKNMQKQIETRHPLIQSSFQDSLRSKSAFEHINQDKMREHLKHIGKFNEKYELISERVTEIRNINKIIHFSQALQKFKVNARLLKSMMQDFDQNASSKMQSELLNTLKISKIIKQISNITIKFDFSGIKSYEEERHFVNNTRGAIFGLVEKELAVFLNKIPHLGTSRREQTQNQIINKFIVLNNIIKLKQFCIPFYKNKLKEMSELVKKSISIGQSAYQNDSKAFLEIFEEFFTNSLRKNIVQNGVIFIAFDQSLAKSNLKTMFNFSFFQKYWQNVTGFMKDLITYSIDKDAKAWQKQKLSQNLADSFSILQTKQSLSKYLTSIIWKYPVIYESLTSISNEIHLHLIKNADYHNYQFQDMKQMFLTVLVPLAQLYYKHSKLFYESWKDKIEKIKLNLDHQVQKADNLPVKMVVQLFQERKSSKKSTVDQQLKIAEWLVFNLKTKQIFDFHGQQILTISDQYLEIFNKIIQQYDSEKHNKDDLYHFLDQCENMIGKIKKILKRAPINKSGQLTLNMEKVSGKDGILSSSCAVLLDWIRRFKGYEQWVLQKRELLR